jgi:hypothetical protein
MQITRATQRPLKASSAPGIERCRVWGEGHGVAVEFCRERREVAAVAASIVLLSFGQLEKTE